MRAAGHAHVLTPAALRPRVLVRACAQGEDVVLSQVLQPVSALAGLPQGAGSLVHVNSFSIDYRPDGSVAQFFR